MYSGAMAATIGTHDRGVAIVTSPAPDRSAPSAARCAAPVRPLEPATISTRPKSPLCESGCAPARSRASARASAARDTGLRARRSPDAESRCRRSPGRRACVSAGGNTSGIFGAASVTVIDASMAGPSTSCAVGRHAGRQIDRHDRHAEPVDVGDDGFEQAGELPRKPVPTMASTIRSHSEISLKCSSHSCALVISTTVRPMLPRISRLVRASPRTSATLPSRNTAASTPRCTSVRATTNPSPPLLPRPQITPTRLVARSSNAASIAATACRPAFSISTIEGMPMSSIVRRSASRICSVFSTRIACRAYCLC